MTKYYKPNIEDMHIGYECEEYVPDWSRNIDFPNPESYYEWFLGNYEGQLGQPEFKKVTLTGGNLQYLEKFNPYRTAYLDHDQIEAEGWKLHTDLEYGRYIMYQLVGSYWFLTLRDNHEIEIHNNEDYSDRDTLFKGKCLSINEFRKIINQCINE